MDGPPRGQSDRPRASPRHVLSFHRQMIHPMVGWTCLKFTQGVLPKFYRANGLPRGWLDLLGLSSGSLASIRGGWLVPWSVSNDKITKMNGCTMHLWTWHKSGGYNSNNVQNKEMTPTLNPTTSLQK